MHNSRGAGLRSFSLCFLLVFLFFVGLLPLYSDDSPVPVSVQLRWDHQFQFAGYYAALWQGYYEEAGLEVEIRSAMGRGERMNPIEEVAQGRADFGIGSVNILTARDQGADLRILASYFQTSPAGYYIRKGADFTSLSDFLRLQVARLPNDLVNIELQTLLSEAGIDPAGPNYVDWDVDEWLFQEGKADAIPGYDISAAFVLEQAGVEYTFVSAAQYGIYFYGDSLFCRGDYLQQNRDTVDAFLEATRKGWLYALQHPDEISREISENLERHFPLEDIGAFNDFQAEKVPPLFQYPVVPIGHLSSERWDQIYRRLYKLGLVSRVPLPEEYLYLPLEEENLRYRRNLTIIEGILLAAMVALAAALIFNGWMRLRIKRSELQVQALFSESRTIMLVIDPGSKRILNANRSAEEFYGYPAETLREMSLYELEAAEAADLDEKVEHLGSARTESLSGRHRIANGIIRDVQIYASRLNLGKKGEVLYCIIHDVSEYRRLENIKQEFLANMSHEMRTPLNGIMGMHSLIRLQNPDPAVGEYLSLAEESAESLLHMVENLLDLSEIQASHIALNEEEFDLIPLLESLIVAYRKHAREKSLNLELDTPVDAYLYFGDRRRLFQVLNNLVSNALKYTDQGAVRIRLELEPTLAISVIDTGIGIAEYRLEEIFTVFHQLEDPYTKTHRGMGVGLGLTRMVCEKMGIELQVESELDRGSRFTVRLPEREEQLRPEAAPSRTIPAASKAGGGKILVVEDEAINRFFLTKMLKQNGFSVVEAGDGLEAQQLIRTIEVNMVLLDLGLPKMNGLQLLSWLRSRPNTARLPVFAVTAHAHSDDIQRLTEAGADGVILKPYNEGRILEAIEPYFG